MEKQSNNKKFSIEFINSLATRKRGKLLSTEYVNIDSKLKWQCEFEHEWEASLYSIKNMGAWCHYCCGFARLTIEEMQTLANKMGGRCCQLHTPPL